MREKRKHRGISLGTLIMLAVTLLVVGGMMQLLPKLRSDTDVKIDTSKVLAALSLGEGLPELTLSEIPIQAQSDPQQEPAATASVAANAGAATAPPTVIPSMQPVSTPIPGGSFTLTLGGSVAVEGTLRKACYYSEAEKYDFTDIMTLLIPEMQSDMTVVSLENLIIPDKKVSDTITPQDVLPMLTTAGVDGVALGFKQAYDQGMAGVQSTIQAVQSKGLTALGLYEADGQEKRISGSIMTLGGVKVALLHYTDGLSSKGAKAAKKDGNSWTVPQAVLQDDNGAGMAADIAMARAQGAQVVIVSLNWGTAGKSSPTKSQTALAQSLADAGADVIVGTGSRVVQPVQWLTGKRADGSDKRTLCAYSLGAILNDSRTNGNVAAMLLQLQIACDGSGEVTFEKAAYTPTYIWRYKQDGRYYYRVVASDQPAPDGMSSDQQKSMSRALQTVQKALGADTPLTLRER